MTVWCDIGTALDDSALLQVHTGVPGTAGVVTVPKRGNNRCGRARGLPLEPARIDVDGLRVARHRPGSYPVSLQRLEVITESADPRHSCCSRLREADIALEAIAGHHRPETGSTPDSGIQRHLWASLPDVPVGGNRAL
jgi:hypothetical protein